MHFWWHMEHVFDSQKIQAARVSACQVLSGCSWVLLGIRCSVTLCLCFGSWMNIMRRSESHRNYGRDSGDSLLTMNTG